MEKDETNDKSKSDQPTKPKKRSILDSPKQRRLFEKMGMIYKVDKPDTDDKKNEGK